MLGRLRRTESAQPVDGPARRSNFLKRARSQSPHVAARIGDEVFVVRTDDIGVGKGVFVYGGRNDVDGLSEALGRLREYGIALPDEPVFVDVGANIGTTTVMALRRHGFASAVAIEPSPDNFRTLRLNLVANDIESRVNTIRAAVSDREGEVWFDVSRPSCGSYRIVPEEADGAVAVDAVTLDGLVERGAIDPARVGMLWVDAVGSEPKVLIGASSLLRAGVPAVVAVRRKMRLDPETRAAVTRIFTQHYTDIAEIRRLHVSHPIAELDTLLDQVERVTDVLLVRR